MNNSFSKNSLMTLFSDGLIFLFSFLALIIITRILGPQGKGIYALILLIPSLMMSFGSFGISASNVYFTGNRKYKIRDVVSNSIILVILLGPALIFLFWALLQFDFFQKFIESNQLPYLYLWLAVLSMPLSLLLRFFQNIIRGRGDIANYNKTRILEGLIGLIAVFLLLVLFKQGIFGAVFSYVLSLIAALIFALILLRRLSELRFSLNKKLLKESFVYGGKVYVANAFSFLNYRLDMLLIAFFLTPAAVGLYSVAVGISERLFIISGAIATVLFPKISSLRFFEANNLTSKIIRHTFFIMIILSLVLGFLAYPLIKLFFGSAFLPSMLPLIILMPGIIAFGIGGVIAADLGGRGKPQFAVYSSLCCLIVNLVLNLILIPKIGIAGAALATSISYWADTLVILIAFLKISKKPLAEVLIIKKEDFKDYFKLFPWKTKN